MANITITVQSLLNTAVYDSYTIDNGQTVAQLKTAVNLAQGFDSTWYDLVNGNVLTESSTLASLGIVSGTALRTHNKIGRLSTRQARQEAKLALAGLDRVESGETRTTLTINDLPTKYSGNTLVNNANSGGLVLGRPWS
jgi:ABC-type transporter Mla subunit MlaD